MVRLNITLPEEIAKKLAKQSNKSRFIAEALKEKMERDRKRELEGKLLEGYRASVQNDAEIQDDWEKTDIEGWD